MFILTLVYLLECFLGILCHEDVFVVKYNKDNFSQETHKKNHFIMFYAPWYVNF